MFDFLKKKVPTTDLSFYSQGRKRFLRNVPVSKMEDVSTYMLRFELLSHALVEAAAPHARLVGKFDGALLEPSSAYTALLLAGKIDQSFYDKLLFLQKYHNFFLYAENYDISQKIFDMLTECAIACDVA